MAAPSYKSTNDVLDVVQGQLEDQFSGEAGRPKVDQVILFDSSLNQAIEDHFGAGTAPSLMSAIMVSFLDVLPDPTSGDGLSLRDGLLLDMYVIIRSTGRARYDEDRRRLNDLTDYLWHSAFHFTNARANYKTHIGAMQAVTIRRLEAGSDILARQVQFVCKPQRT